MLLTARLSSPLPIQMWSKIVPKISQESNSLPIKPVFPNSGPPVPPTAQIFVVAPDSTCHGLDD